MVVINLVPAALSIHAVYCRKPLNMYLVGGSYFLWFSIRPQFVFAFVGSLLIVEAEMILRGEHASETQNPNSTSQVQTISGTFNSDTKQSNWLQR